MDDAITRARHAAATSDWLITARQAAQCGLSREDIDRELRGGRWHAVQRGVYLLDADVYRDGLPQRTMWRAALLAQGGDACLVGTTAMRAHGAAGLPLPATVIEIGLIGGPSRHRRGAPLPGAVDADRFPSVVVRQLPIAAHEVHVVDGLLVRDARYSLVDAALQFDRASAFALLDSSLHLGLVTRDELLASVAAAQHRRGIVALRWLAERADARAESPVESRVRLVCIDVHLAPDDLQYRVIDRTGHLVAIGDLAWYKRRRRPLLAEADGTSIHSLPEPVFRDRTRGNALAGEACDTVRFTAADSYRPRYIEYVIRTALAAA